MKPCISEKSAWNCLPPATPPACEVVKESSLVWIALTEGAQGLRAMSVLPVARPFNSHVARSWMQEARCFRDRNLYPYENPDSSTAPATRLTPFSVSSSLPPLSRSGGCPHRWMTHNSSAPALCCGDRLAGRR